MKCSSLKVLCSVVCVFVFHSALSMDSGAGSNKNSAHQNNTGQVINYQQMEQQRQSLLRHINQLIQETRQTIQQLQQLQDQRNEYARLEQQDLPTNKQERESLISRIRTLQNSIPALEEQLQGQVSTGLSGLWRQYNQASVVGISADWSDEERKVAMQRIRETRASLLDQIREATQREIADLSQHIEQGQREYNQLNAI